ncbi:Uncharacterized protein DAT39_010855, partial [Clarias magur]
MGGGSGRMKGGKGSAGGESGPTGGGESGPTGRHPWSIKEGHGPKLQSHKPENESFVLMGGHYGQKNESFKPRVEHHGQKNQSFEPRAEHHGQKNESSEPTREHHGPKNEGSGRLDKRRSQSPVV